MQCPECRKKGSSSFNGWCEDCWAERQHKNTGSGYSERLSESVQSTPRGSSRHYTVYLEDTDA